MKGVMHVEIHCLFFFSKYTGSKGLSNRKTQRERSELSHFFGC